MLVRRIRASISACRLFCFSSITENNTVARNFNESLGSKLFHLRNPSEAPNVIAKWKEEGHDVSPSEITSALRGHTIRRRFHHALMILDSLAEQNIVELNPRDNALHLSLIANFKGVDRAERYFEEMPEGLKNEFLYGVFLSIYAERGETAKAEALMEKMAGNGFLRTARPYIHMMSLYMSIGRNDKAEEMIAEVKKRIKPNDHNYNNKWLNACVSANNVEAADTVLSEMKKANVKPSFVTYGSLAGLYIKNKLFDKATRALKKGEELLLSGESVGRNAYCSLIRHHGKMGNADEVLRMWDNLKIKFRNLSDYEYSLVISTLLKADWYEKAEEIYSEWGALIHKDCRVSKPHRATSELLEKAKAGRNSGSLEEYNVEKAEEKPIEPASEEEEEIN